MQLYIFLCVLVCYIWDSDWLTRLRSKHGVNMNNIDNWKHQQLRTIATRATFRAVSRAVPPNVTAMKSQCKSIYGNKSDCEKSSLVTLRLRPYLCIYISKYISNLTVWELSIILFWHCKLNEHLIAGAISITLTNKATESLNKMIYNTLLIYRDIFALFQSSSTCINMINKYILQAFGFP